MLRRSQLYVPGNNEKMISKAALLEADSVILDLEDAVPAREKEDARRLVARLSRELEWGSRELCLRVNPSGSPEFKKDLAVARAAKRIDTLVIPKAEGDCSPLKARTGKPLIPIIETATGFMNLRSIAGSKGIAAITYGAADYAASVGGSVSAYLDNDVLKTTIVAAAAAARVDALDNVFFNLDDPDGFRRQAVAARSLGYVGKQVVHPSQIGPANDIFSPTDEEVEWAKKVLLEFRTASGKKRGAIRLEGALVDAVHSRLAKGILERKRQIGEK
ncbi:MAG: CoA ester lyase [Nitrososphaerales archaeon]|nr:CoA ester lyase [Nitrososphaerales archaeon]